MKRVRSINLTQFAKGQECTLRVPGVCCHDPETTVFCHVSTKSMGAMGGKTHDFFGFIGCYKCHEWHEQRKGTEEERSTYTLDALSITLGAMFEAGLLIIG